MKQTVYKYLLQKRRKTTISFIINLASSNDLGLSETLKASLSRQSIHGVKTFNNKGLCDMTIDIKLYNLYTSLISMNVVNLELDLYIIFTYRGFPEKVPTATCALRDRRIFSIE